jgi:hypothetical protein
VAGLVTTQGHKILEDESGVSHRHQISDVEGLQAELDSGGGGGNGLSAYEVAVANGFVGTEAEWLSSLVGPQGPAGADGEPGIPGADGAQGIQGPAGADGAQGPQGLPGDDGAQGPQGIQGIQGVKGDTGDTGPQGPAGADGAGAPIKAGLVNLTAGGTANVVFASPFASVPVVVITAQFANADTSCTYSARNVTANGFTAGGTGNPAGVVGWIATTAGNT